jgi:hypothetical protein
MFSPVALNEIGGHTHVVVKNDYELSLGKRERCVAGGRTAPTA